MQVKPLKRMIIVQLLCNSSQNHNYKFFFLYSNIVLNTYICTYTSKYMWNFTRRVVQTSSISNRHSWSSNGAANCYIWLSWPSYCAANCYKWLPWPRYGAENCYMRHSWFSNSVVSCDCYIRQSWFSNGAANCNLRNDDSLTPCSCYKRLPARRNIRWPFLWTRWSSKVWRKFWMFGSYKNCFLWGLKAAIISPCLHVNLTRIAQMFLQMSWIVKNLVYK